MAVRKSSWWTTLPPTSSGFASSCRRRASKWSPPRAAGRNLQDQGRDADLVLMDVVMPGLNGFKLPRDHQERFPASQSSCARTRARKPIASGA